MTRNTSLTKKEKKNVKEMIANGISAEKIMVDYKISERTYLRIKSIDFMSENSLEIFSNTYRSEYKTKYSNINIATLKFVDECSQYGVPIKEFMIKEAAF